MLAVWQNAIAEKVREASLFNVAGDNEGLYRSIYKRRVLVISCHSPKVKVIGQKVKGHGSKRGHFWINA